MFVTAVQKQFAFLVSRFTFEPCGLLPTRPGDRRDAEFRTRYRGPTRTIDLVSSMSRGLALDVANRRRSSDPGDCLTAAAPPLVDSRGSCLRGTNPS